VVEDSQARQRYGAALYPIRWAQVPLAKARGTENLVGWYAIRDMAADVTTDVFGNFIPAKKDATIVQKNRLFVREGTRSRIVEANRFTLTMQDLRIDVSDSAAGIIARTAPTEVILAIPKGRVSVEFPHPIQATEGRFELDHWQAEHEFKVQTDGKATIIEIHEPKVIILRY
jgi:hypothetical protein